ncbi:hypothetical protein [uncultured Rikenella sp.]|uniref:hypothetical protein n=1 Tax=uncultured Rikenella sp. TaxID=368003 RepID=UPI002729941A|nr:hypothetical protein [uncultured Rikenella sp.]
MQEWIGWGFSVKRGKGIAGISEVFGVLFFRGGIAPGYRDAGNNDLFGALGLVGNHIASWSASANGAYGLYVYSYKHYFGTGGSGHRAHGLPLRCLSE